MKRWYIFFFILLIIIAIYFYRSFRKMSPEEAIREAVERIERYGEQQNIHGIMSFVSDEFRDPDAGGKPELLYYLRIFYKRYPHPWFFRLKTDVNLKGDGTADIDIVALRTVEEIREFTFQLPENSVLFTIEATLKEEKEEDWKVVYGNYYEMNLMDVMEFLPEALKEGIE